MDTIKTRRKALAAFAGAAVIAQNEIREASATGSYCRREGHSCNGNQRCCGDLECEYSGHGNNRVCVEVEEEPEEPICEHDGECPDQCYCDGDCKPVDPSDPVFECVAYYFNEQKAICITHYGRRRQRRCGRLFPAGSAARRRCIRRNNRMRARFSVCQSEARTFANVKCGYTPA